MAGNDTVKGNCLGNFNNFILEEGKGTPDQNWGAGGQIGGIQPKYCFAEGIII